MGSKAVELVAQDVIKAVENGERPKITEIAPKRGLSRRYADSGKIQKTKTFQKIVGNALNSFENERQKIFEEMGKKRKKAPYSSLVGGLEVTSKNIQLLSGGATENVQVKEDHKVILDILKNIQERNDK